MNRVIYRYKAPILGRATIHAPADAKLVSAVPGTKGWNLYMEHVELDDDAPSNVPHEFASIKTGVVYPCGGEWKATTRGGFHIIQLTAEAAEEYDAMYPLAGALTFPAVCQQIDKILRAAELLNQPEEQQA